MKVQRISNNNNNPNFGVKYTRGSIDTLYKLLPDMSETSEFYFSKNALENLIKAKKRNDNLLVDIREDMHGYNLFKFFVKHQDNKSKIFREPVIAPGMSEYNSYAEDFLAYSEFINSDKFVKESNRIMMLNYTRQSKLPLWKKAKEKFIRVTKIDDWGKELLITIEDAIEGIPMRLYHPDGTVTKNVKGFSYFWASVKDMICPKKPTQTPFQVRKSTECEELSKLINKLAE